MQLLLDAIGAGAICVTIEGAPIYEGRRLGAEDPVFREPASIERLIAFCRKLRGEFAIVIRDGENRTIAITDLVASVPIYRLDRRSRAPLVSTRLCDLAPHATGALSPEALYHWAVHGGCGLRPLYDGVHEVEPASLAILTAERVVSHAYFDWNDIEPRPGLSLDAACDEFADIATSYLRSLSAGEDRVACFLSGGTDSAIIAFLAREAGMNVVGVTADYAPRRYSELREAARAAARLGVPHRPVRVGRREFAAAVEALRARDCDAPSGYAQATSVHAIGASALAEGTRLCLDGDFVGDLFLEFDDYTRGLPPGGSDYARAVAGLTLDDYIRRRRQPATPGRFRLTALAALGLDPRAAEDWARREREAEWAERRALFERHGYPLCDRIYALKHVGAKYRGLWLAARRAIGPEMSFASPFLDRAMIEFALALPLELLYRDGVAKWLLRQFLSAKTGLVQQKRYSPNPSRLWWLLPRFRDWAGARRELRGALLRLQLRNLVALGGCYSDLAELAALAHWLRHHPLSVAPSTGGGTGRITANKAATSPEELWGPVPSSDNRRSTSS
ncbi:MULTISPECIES: asparagine synthase-related protein [Methylosinus]|uniref:asparagine synthase (glutamine-hydrolyzing) n=1 Tax=Methylosinus trichosporium (strain ATCC 35070 / NCIMB 11131 / UNIQEM 75 / OB3b) TaxID=595536 RepID=A0A2D2CY31_METT3|nr:MULTISPECIES: asparagine synthase C-terminal domain-containing protein [Methylosinus]ATQ67635.1 asparagine synthetase B family protein [Methylosinus trichosporium OB3b]OBS51755.1 hypothetical protein A8B73_14530 [Methylosinus sp. 3S-1]